VIPSRYLGMTGRPPAASPCDPISLGLVTRVLDGLLGQEPALGWDDTTYVVKGTGRIGLTEAERTQLGPAAERSPLFG
jgi:hypothetical protein